jgi:rod shape determining protein RodA
MEQNYKIIFLVFTGLLFLTLFTGSIRGSKRWIDIGFFQFQTSEFFKPFFISCLAAVLNAPNRFSRLKLFAVFGMFLIPCFAIFLQPDLGSAIIYTTTFAAIFFFSGLSSKITAIISAVLVGVIPFLWPFLKEYQKARIIGFLNPELDPQGITYNVTQAIIAVGSGGFLGKGLGLGTQAQYRFLPEFHTDFAFASFIEQFGFVGGVLLFLIYALLFYRLVKKMFLYKDSDYKFLFLIGTISLIFFEAVINIGMNLGLMPVTGIALPFISYGGSSLLSTMMLLGIASAL